MWVSGPRPRKQRLPQESREALPRLCQEEGRVGVGEALTGGAPEQCLWEASVAPVVRHLRGINRDYFRRLSPEALCLQRKGRHHHSATPRAPHSSRCRHTCTKPNLTRHRIQPQPSPNAATPGTKSKHTPQQIPPL